MSPLEPTKRRLYISQLPLKDLQRTCDHCGRFFVPCRYSRLTTRYLLTCHSQRVVYVDGACTNNGRDDAVAGIGGAMGMDEQDRWSIPVDPTDSRSTSQRAELLAAIAGLARMITFCEDILEHRRRNQRHARGCERDKSISVPCIIVATDSEYVVKGMTEWYEAWQARNWRTASGKVPSNLEFFHTLNNMACEMEDRGWTTLF